MQWRGIPLMKNVFDFAMYPALIAELRPRTIFEIGSGLGASALWFADTMAFSGTAGHVHSVDQVKARLEHPGVTFYQGDCAAPDRLFDRRITARRTASMAGRRGRPPQCGGGARAISFFLLPGDYLVVEDSDVKRDVLRNFTAAHPGDYLVDTRFTDNFGRNATCAANSIFIRTASGE